MRAVVQRVLEASVTVEGLRVGSIGPGLLVLLGVGKSDGSAQADWMARKLSALRIFDDVAGKMNRSVADVGGSVLMVSQFTLYADARSGNRPSFLEAMAPEPANQLYQRVCEAIAASGLKVERGVFRADMKVASTNDGPVTLCLDSASS